jgi:hypothetical protein
VPVGQGQWRRVRVAVGDGVVPHQATPKEAHVCGGTRNVRKRKLTLLCAKSDSVSDTHNSSPSGLGEENHQKQSL